MAITNNASTALKEETIWQKLDDDAKAAWQQVKNFCTDDIWPIVVDFAHLIVSQLESAESGEALAVIGDLVMGNYAAASTAVLTTAEQTAADNAAADAKAALAASPLSTLLPSSAPQPLDTQTGPVVSNNAPDGEVAADAGTTYTHPDGSTTST